MEHYTFSVCVIFAIVCAVDIESSIIKSGFNDTCSALVDGVQTNIRIGDTWNTTEPCVNYVCEASENGEPTPKMVRKYCYLTCNNEFEMIIANGKCCGECIQTKCKSDNGSVHTVGEMWKSPDSCTYFECVLNKATNSGVSVYSYKKTCDSIGDCPVDQMVTRDCCPVCDTNWSSKESTKTEGTRRNFIYNPDKYTEIMDKNTYLHHPCARDCLVGGASMTCNYTFIVEWYETLSKACFDCPNNETDCYRPHCIFGDGIRRTILTINRMMPGPRLQVCLGDQIRVDVINQMMGESTTIHWHGMHQKDTPFMDGVPMITQCPIPPHTTFRYTFTADHEGTHWWHSHTGVQRSDGALGALIVRKPIADIPSAVSKLYEFDLPEHTILYQDWEHIQATASFSSFHHSIGNNKPKNILINARGKYFEPSPLKEAPPMTGNNNKRLDPITLSPPEKEVSVTTEFLANEVDVTQNILDQGAYVDTTSEQETVPSETNGTETKYSVDLKTSRMRRDASVEPALTPLEIFHVTAGRSYRFRTINAGFLNCPIETSVDGHNITVIASDGEYFEPVVVSTLVSYAGERFDFVLNADQPVGNYWVRVRGLMDCDERFTKAHQVAVLRYGGAADEHPTADRPTYDYKREGLQMNALNRGTGLMETVSIAELTSLEPNDDPRLLEEHTDFQFYVYYDFYDSDNPHFNHPSMYSNTDMDNPANQFIGPQLNRITMKMPSSPLLTARNSLDDSNFCNASSLAARNIDCTEEFCECSHVLQVPLNSTVELVLVDEGYRYDANHPFHLHGHTFQVVAMERLQPSGIDVKDIQALDKAGLIKRRLIGAPTKDTITVPDGGYTIIRFVANNPGYWLFHCHIEYHVEVGMALVFKVGDHRQMRPVPKNFPTCSSYMPRVEEAGSDANRIRTTCGWLLLVFVLISWLREAHE